MELRPVPDLADPFALFDAWYAEAKAAEINDPNAMTLATVGPDGRPSARIVLMKGVGPEGFVFYTNRESRKGQELASHPAAALLFHWKSLQRQVRVEGAVTPVPADEADRYFAGRPRLSKIGAWASDQSRPLADREVFERRVAEAERRFPGEAVPRPPHWGGFRLTPETMEFWQEMPFRLHDRILFSRAAEGWAKRRLYP